MRLELYWIDSDTILRNGGFYDDIETLREKAGEIFQNYADSSHTPVVLFKDEDNYIRQMFEDETI